MAGKFVQTQSGFSGGQSNPSALSRVDNTFFSRAIKLENVIVDKEGSVSVRNGFKKEWDFEVVDNRDVIVDILKVFRLEGNTFLFLAKTRSGLNKLYFKVKGGSPYVEEIKFDSGVLSYDLFSVGEAIDKFDYGNVFKQHGFSTGLNGIIKEANQLGERVFVFFENNFPWKVWVEGNILKSTPFFEGELNKLWRAFPFNRTNSEDINVRNMVFRRSGNRYFKYRDEDEKLQLKIKNVTWSEVNLIPALSRFKFERRMGGDGVNYYENGTINRAVKGERSIASSDLISLIFEDDGNTYSAVFEDNFLKFKYPIGLKLGVYSSSFISNFKTGVVGTFNRLSLSSLEEDVNVELVNLVQTNLVYSSNGFSFNFSSDFAIDFPTTGLTDVKNRWIVSYKGTKTPDYLIVNSIKYKLGDALNESFREGPFKSYATNIVVPVGTNRPYQGEGETNLERFASSRLVFGMNIKFKDEDTYLYNDRSFLFQAPSGETSEHEGECEIYLDYENKSDGDYVDQDFASCRKFKGKPICFSVGRRALTVRGANVSEWQIEGTSPLIEGDNLAVAIAKKLNPALDPIPDEPTIEDVSAVTRNDVAQDSTIPRLPVTATTLNIFIDSGTFFVFIDANETTTWSYNTTFYYSIDIRGRVVRNNNIRDVRGNIPSVRGSVSFSKLKYLDLSGSLGIRDLSILTSAPIPGGYLYHPESSTSVSILYVSSNYYLALVTHVQPLFRTTAYKRFLIKMNANRTLSVVDGGDTNINSFHYNNFFVLDNVVYFNSSYNSRTLSNPYRFIGRKRLDNLADMSGISFDRNFKRFFVSKENPQGTPVATGGSLYYWLVSGNSMFKYTSSGSFVNRYDLDREIKGFDGTNFYSQDNLGVYKLALSSLTAHTAPAEGEPEEESDFILAEKLAKAKLNRLRLLNSVQIERVFASLGFRFYVVFPFQQVGGNYAGNTVRSSNFYGSEIPRMKCKLYSIGFSVNQFFGNQVNHLGGENLIDGVEGGDFTDNFIVNDWEDGFPIMGNRIAGKDFFITSGSKLSFSDGVKNPLFGNPIKALFNSSGFNYRNGRIIREGLAESREDVGEGVIDEGNTFKYLAILSDNIVFKSQPLQEFFDDIDKGLNAIQFNIVDSATYNVRDAQGIKPKIYSLYMSDIGAFVSSGSQAIALSDKGVFYWGLNLSERSPIRFLNLAKVSRFTGSAKYKASFEALNRVYMQDDRGDVYVITYDLANRNFSAMPGAFDSNLRRLVSAGNFVGDSILGVEETGKLFCSYSNPKGELTSESQFVLDKHKFINFSRFRDDYYLSVKHSSGLCRFLKYKNRDDTDIGKDSVDGGGQDFYGVIETAPLVLGVRFPAHSLRSIKKILYAYVFSRDLKDFEIRQGPNWKSVSVYDRGILKQISDISSYFIGQNVNLGRGLELRIKGTNRGSLSGVSIYFDSQEMK